MWSEIQSHIVIAPSEKSRGGAGSPKTKTGQQAAGCDGLSLGERENPSSEGQPSTDRNGRREAAGCPRQHNSQHTHPRTQRRVPLPLGFEDSYWGRQCHTTVSSLSSTHLCSKPSPRTVRHRGSRRWHEDSRRWSCPQLSPGKQRSPPIGTQRPAEKRGRPRGKAFEACGRPADTQAPVTAARRGVVPSETRFPARPCPSEPRQWVASITSIQKSTQ